MQNYNLPLKHDYYYCYYHRNYTYIKRTKNHLFTLLYQEYKKHHETITKVWLPYKFDMVPLFIIISNLGIYEFQIKRKKIIPKDNWSC